MATLLIYLVLEQLYLYYIYSRAMYWYFLVQPIYEVVVFVHELYRLSTTVLIPMCSVGKEYLAISCL